MQKFNQLKSLVILLLCAAVSCAAEPKIIGETKVQPYRFVELSIQDAPADAAIIWDIYPEEHADIRERDGTLWFVAPPGSYKVKVRLIQGKHVSTLRTGVDIASGPLPPVPIPPVPTPPTPPQPPIPVVGEPLTVYVIEESADAVQGRARIFADRNLVAWLQQKKIKVKLIDKDVIGPDGKKPTELVKYLDQTTAYPSMYVVNYTGSTIYSAGFAFTNPAEFKRILGAIAGP